MNIGLAKDATQGGDQTASLDKFNTGAGAFGFGWGAKDGLIDYAKSSGGSLEGLAGYAKVVKGVAFAGNVLDAGIVVTKVLVNRQIMPSDILEESVAGLLIAQGFIADDSNNGYGYTEKGQIYLIALLLNNAPASASLNFVVRRIIR